MAVSPALLLRTASSNPDAIARNTVRLLKYGDKSNQIELQADFSRFTAMSGRYR